ncbi:MAG: hypothetical protein NC820_00260 [Candidatus Omnitrophica bacterium]|nr:hypothetical protein [Candidatus Omnitrophota bacterium]
MLLNIIKEKIRQRDFFKKEEAFWEDKGDKLGIVSSYCIPNIISSLWK